MPIDKAKSATRRVTQPSLSFAAFIVERPGLACAAMKDFEQMSNRENLPHQIVHCAKCPNKMPYIRKCGKSLGKCGKSAACTGPELVAQASGDLTDNVLFVTKKTSWNESFHLKLLTTLELCLVEPFGCPNTLFFSSISNISILKVLKAPEFVGSPPVFWP